MRKGDSMAEEEKILCKCGCAREDHFCMLTICANDKECMCGGFVPARKKREEVTNDIRSSKAYRGNL